MALLSVCDYLYCIIPHCEGNWTVRIFFFSSKLWYFDLTWCIPWWLHCMVVVFIFENLSFVRRILNFTCIYLLKIFLWTFVNSYIYCQFCFWDVIYIQILLKIKYSFLGRQAQNKVFNFTFYFLFLFYGT